MLEDIHAIFRQAPIALHAYVLMPDHFHLLATPAGKGRLSWAMQAVGRRFVRWYNQRHGRVGTLWEGRFRSTLIEPALHLVDVMRFIELHPVRAGLVADPAHYPWSSLPHHLGLRVDPLVTDHPDYWALGNTPFERQARYAAACATPLDPARVESITAAVQRGWPLGSPAFLQALAQKTDRRLVPRPAGRPRAAGRLAGAPSPARGG